MRDLMTRVPDSRGVRPTVRIRCKTESECKTGDMGGEAENPAGAPIKPRPGMARMLVVPGQGPSKASWRCPWLRVSYTLRPPVASEDLTDLTDMAVTWGGRWGSVRAGARARVRMRSGSPRR